MVQLVLLKATWISPDVPGTAAPTLPEAHSRLLCSLATGFAFWLAAAETMPSTRYEYATIRWDGRDNTHIVHPGGQVENTSGDCARRRSRTGLTTEPST